MSGAIGYNVIRPLATMADQRGLSSLLLDLNTYAGFHPAAELALGSIEFGRARLAAGVKDLTPEQLSAKPTNFSNDIATLLLHIGGSEVSMCHLIQGKEVPAELQQIFLLDQRGKLLPRPEGETVASLLEKLDTSLAIVKETLAEVSEADLSRHISPGGDRTFSVRWIIGLLPVHQFLHLGHIQTLLKHI